MDLPDLTPRRVIAILAISLVGILGFLWWVIAAPRSVGRDPSRQVTAEEFGDGWPLTVPEGVLRCSNEAVTITVDGSGGQVETYAVNGQAATVGFPEIEPIWAEGELAPRKNIHPLIAAGLELCD